MISFKPFLCSLFLICSLQIVQAQTQPIDPSDAETTNEESSNDDGDSGDDKKNWVDNIVVGGNLGAQFGQATYIEASPIVGYRITEMLTAGVGFTYQYFSENYNLATFADYKAQVLGPRVFVQHDLIYGLFAHAEFEHSWVKFTYEDPTYGEYTNDVSALFLGMGYNYEVGSNSRFQIMLLYDVLHNIESIYYSPWVVRMGFNIGL